MSCKIKQRFWLLAVLLIVGLFMAIATDHYTIAPVLAQTKQPDELIDSTTRAIGLEKQGQQFYTLHQFEHALDFWQQANTIYTSAGDLLSRSRVLSNIALAYSQLGDWEKANQSIASSLNLLAENQEKSLEDTNRQRTLAQVLNNQGILQLAQGNTEQAVASWSKAKTNYQLVGDDLGVLRATINQASGFKNLGLYHRAVKTLTKIETTLSQQPDSALKATGLRNYGELLHLVGDQERSRQVLAQSLAIATKLNSPEHQAKTRLALGKTLKANQPAAALKLYRQGLKTCLSNADCSHSQIPLKINLAQLNLLLKTENWQQGALLIAKIESKLNNLPNNRENIWQKLNFAHNLVKLNQKAEYEGIKLDIIPDWQAIEQILVNSKAQAVKLQDRRSESYALGLQGQIYEHLQQWQAARKYTQQALVVAQNINAAEISYLWHWQLGRISLAQQDRARAIAHYTQAIELLKSLTQDLVAIATDVQYSFHESVEPVYRQLVSLLLATTGNTEISQANLEQAREVIESLQLAELHNFFREACLDTQAVNIDGLDAQAAVIYPIILSDRLEIILSLSGQPLRHYSLAIPQQQLEATIEQLRQSIVVRSRRQFYAPAQKLYNWLIQPVLKDLAANQIKTLVFVPDGAFRNVPMAALYDGKHYLIEKYGIALTPGLQLLAPKPIEQIQLQTIAAGLTKQRQGFSALDNVDSELAAIEARLNSTILLNEQFTSEALKEKIQFADHSIVHIATHGQFSSVLEDTFILAWDSRININQLNNILKTRTFNQTQAIELLVLSACETATGDKQAALGLAGMAVQAGAKSTLATFWSVDDLSTAKFMAEFYHQLATKTSGKAEAARQAQLSLLHHSWYKHPYYWAPYVLIGNWL